MLSRETRLLLATIAISAVVVLVLSTLRFPESPRLTEAPPAPLERLAASAAYDQLARIVDRVARRVRPDLLVVRSGPATSHLPRNLNDLLTQPMAADVAQHYPALRIDNERAVVAADVPPGAVVLYGESTIEAGVLASDPLRQLTLLSVPPAESTSVAPLTLSQFQTPTYVVVAEGTAGGIAFRPVFVGSADRFADARWQRPLLAVSGTALTNAGALVFSLEGQFVGAAVVPQNGTFAVAGAAELLSVAGELAATSPAAPQDFGITVQTLSDSAKSALNAKQGLVVVSIDPGGPAAGVLEPLDVLTILDGVSLTRPEDLLLPLARGGPQKRWQLRGVRGREPMEWTLTGSTRPISPPARPDALTWERVAGLGSILRSVPKDTPAARAGLRPGDLIVRAGAVAAPTPAQMASLLRSDNDGPDLVVIVRRDGIDRVLTLTPAQ
jgi:S1-C subfamily serine protease